MAGSPDQSGWPSTPSQCETADAPPGKVERNTRIASARTGTPDSTSRTGKPARMLKSAWTEEWDDPETPTPLGMPLQPIVTARAIARIDRAAAKGVIHKNTAARKKSRLIKQLQSAQA